MTIGDPSVFAIDSFITTGYTNPSLRALGWFTVIVNGLRYGVQQADATMLASSFDEVSRRLADRGTHTAPLFDKCAPEAIAKEFRGFYYTDIPEYHEVDSGYQDRCAVFYSNKIVWAPDGDAAFDDSSYILQFDIGDEARLIAFKSQRERLLDPETLREAIMKADEFYAILQQWHDLFLLEWTALPKKSL